MHLLNIIYPSFKVFVAKVKTTYQIELKIAFDKNKLSAHYKKWSKVLPCLTQLLNMHLSTFPRPSATWCLFER